MRINFIYLTLLFLTIMDVFAQAEQSQNMRAEQQLKRLAAQYESSAQFEQAAEIYYRLAASNALDIPSYAGAKRCYLKTQNFDKFTGLITLLQQSRRDIRYEIDMAEIEYLKDNKKQALAHWQKILDDNPLGIESYIYVGQVMLQNRLLKEAEQCYLSGRKKNKDNNLFIFELVEVYTLQSEFAQAVKELINFLDVTATQIDYIDSRIAMLEKNANGNDAIISALEKELQVRKNQGPVISLLLANSYARAQKYDKALPYYLAVEKDAQERNDKNLGINLYRFAITCMRSNQYSFALQAFEAIIHDYPSSSLLNRARLGLATLLEQQGLYSQAVQYYENFIESWPRSAEAEKALFNIGEIWFSKLDNIPEAEKAYKKLLKEYPKSIEMDNALFRLADCALARQNFMEAETNYERIQNHNKTPDKSNYKKAQYYLARLEFYRGNLPESMNTLDDYFKTKASSAKAADIYENDALELHILLQDYKSDSLGLAAFGRSQLLKQIHQYEKSQQIITEYITKNPGKPIVDEMNLFLAELQRIQGSYEQAIITLEKSKNNPKSIYRDRALFEIGKIYEKDLKIKEKAMSSYETLLADFPESNYIEPARKSIRTLE